jgi:TRAP-type mannitol/chloroaromatic compound transport system permease small subunit
VKKLLIKADSIVGKVSEWSLLVSGCLILLIGFLTSYGVGKRYILNNPDPYSYEISIILLIACILLAIPGVQWNRRQLRVDFIINHLSAKWYDIIAEVFASVLGMIFVGVIIWKSWGIFLYSLKVGQTSQSYWQEPLWPMKLIIPISMGWLFLTLVSQLTHAVIHLVRGTRREDTRIQLDDTRRPVEDAVVLMEETAMEAAEEAKRKEEDG